MSCLLHKVHLPSNLTVEQHHIIPVAWQLQPFKPDVPMFPGPDPDGRGMLWDNRTVELCPTGHRNVHYWLVKLMHGLSGSEDPLVAYKAVKGRGVQFSTAYLALCRYKEAGGSLQALVAAHEWGMS